jgi:hypothetical protein
MSSLVSIGTAANELGVHHATLRRWEEEGKIDPPERTTGGIVGTIWQNCAIWPLTKHHHPEQLWPTLGNRPPAKKTTSLAKWHFSKVFAQHKVGRMKFSPMLALVSIIESVDCDNSLTASALARLGGWCLAIRIDCSVLGRSWFSPSVSISAFR